MQRSVLLPGISTMPRKFPPPPTRATISIATTNKRQRLADTSSVYLASLSALTDRYNWTSSHLLTSIPRNVKPVTRTSISRLSEAAMPMFMSFKNIWLLTRAPLHGKTFSMSALTHAVSTAHFSTHAYLCRLRAYFHSNHTIPLRKV